MTKFIGWSRSVGLALATLLILSWAMLYLDEWVLRRHGEALLQEINSVEVDHSLEKDLTPMVNGWRATQNFLTYCNDEECTYVIRYHTHLPAVFAGDPDDSNLARLLDYSRLRLSAVFGSVSIKHGVVVGKSFGEMVGLPVHVWFDREGAYVPNLAVSTSEIGRNNNYRFPLRGADSRAKHLKGPYGLSVSFDSAIGPEQKEELTDFHFQCITQLNPCLHERDILKAGERLLDVPAN